MSKNIEDSEDPYEYQPYKKDENIKESDTAKLVGKGGGKDDVSEREKKLFEKEEELRKREERLNEQLNNSNVEDPTTEQTKKPNCPVCYPILYHSIRKEMRSGFSKTAAVLGLIGWPLIVIVCALNLLGAIITIFSYEANGNGIPLIGDKIRFVAFAVVWLVASPFVYFITGYWPLYSSLRSLTLFRFFIFFGGYAITLILTLFAICGVFDYGPCGIYAAVLYIPASNGGALLGFIVNLIMTGVWGLTFFYYLVIYVMVIIVFRKEYTSFKQVAELAKEQVMSTVKETAETGLKLAVKTAVSSNLAVDAIKSSIIDSENQ